MCTFILGFFSGTAHVPHESQLARSISRKVASIGLSVFHRPRGTGFKDLNIRNIVLHM